jgi:hypothetical protein
MTTLVFIVNDVGVVIDKDSGFGINPVIVPTVVSIW